jgi:hypothetical protein
VVVVVVVVIVVVSIAEEEEEEANGEGLTGSLGAARAASRTANFASSFLSQRGCTRSLLIARSLFSLFDLIDFAIFFEQALLWL